MIYFIATLENQKAFKKFYKFNLKNESELIHSLVRTEFNFRAYRVFKGLFWYN